MQIENTPVLFKTAHDRPTTLEPQSVNELIETIKEGGLPVEDSYELAGKPGMGIGATAAVVCLVTGAVMTTVTKGLSPMFEHDPKPEPQVKMSTVPTQALKQAPKGYNVQIVDAHDDSTEAKPAEASNQAKESDGANYVNFKGDERKENLIRSILHKPSGRITEEELRTAVGILRRQAGITQSA